MHDSTAVADEIEKIERLLGDGPSAGAGPSSTSGSTPTAAALDVNTAPALLREKQEKGEASSEAPDATPARVYIRKTCPGASGPHLVKVAPGVALSDKWKLEWIAVPEERLTRPLTVRCSACQLQITIAREAALELAE